MSKKLEELADVLEEKLGRRPDVHLLQHLYHVELVPLDTLVERLRMGDPFLFIKEETDECNT